MTWYWWMHWFWITLLAATQGVSMPIADKTSTTEAEEVAQLLSERQSRAMYIPRLPPNVTVLTTGKTSADSNGTKGTTDAPVTEAVNLTTVTPRQSSILLNALRPKLSVERLNISEEQNSTALGEGSNVSVVKVTRPDSSDFLAADESRNLVEEKSFSLQHAPLEERQPEAVAHPRDPEFSINPDEGVVMNAGVIAGVSVACVGAVGILAVGSFVLYRRRYFNGSQAFNDKCSNPDSSGYLDDSTIRDNSEEMYSLDNDSFLNSLEAMTIQNYWTDTVKHTKL